RSCPRATRPRWRPPSKHFSRRPRRRAPPEGAIARARSRSFPGVRARPGSFPCTPASLPRAPVPRAPPHEAPVRFAIRDDDTCYFTPPEALARVYGDVWDRVPIGLATVPFAIGYERAGIPREHWRSGEAFPLERNAALTSALRELLERRRVTVALHGYTHQDFPQGFEFQAAPDPDRRVREGLSYLRGLLQQDISVFVPPHNALSKRALAAVASAGLNILGSFLSFRPSMRPW